MKVKKRIITVICIIIIIIIYFGMTESKTEIDAKIHKHPPSSAVISIWGDEWFETYGFWNILLLYNYLQKNENYKSLEWKR